MSFATIHTRAGLALMTEAQVTGTSINLTEMAVGDGNGNPVTPVDTQTGLVRSVYRAAINRVYKPNPTTQPDKFAAELVVPASVGGFTMREVGIFDSDGTLFAVGNLPETYKPEASEGAFSDTVVRLEFVAMNADVVTVIADPNVTIVTQTWISNNVTAGSLIPGGLTSQVLRKKSNADGDVEWADPTAVNVVVNTVEETQTLSDGQTVVNLVETNTFGLAVYIEGVRLPKQAGADGWQPHATIATRLTLGQSYPAGTQLIAVQNEPASDLPDALRKDQNLADVPNKATARANLDIYSRAEVNQRAPAGMIADFAMSTAPTGWLKCNGAEVSRTTYATLFAAIGTTFGAGNGVSTFRLPDFRGEFRRGWDDGRGIDAGRVFGSAQAGQNAAHTHTATAAAAGGHDHTAAVAAAGNHAHSATVSTDGSHTHTGSTSSGGAHTHGLSSSAGDGPGNLGVGTGLTRNRETTSEGAHSHTLTVDASGAHSHTVSVAATGAHTHTVDISAVADHSHAVTVGSSGGAEARPRNIAVLTCIKY